MEAIGCTDCGYPTLYRGVEKGDTEKFLTSTETIAKKTAIAFAKSTRSKTRPLERALTSYFKKFARRRLTELRRNGTLRMFAGGNTSKVSKSIVPVVKVLTRKEEEDFVDLILKYGNAARDAEATRAKREVEDETIPLIWPSSFYTSKRRILGETLKNLDSKTNQAIRDVLSLSTQDTIRPTISALSRRLSSAITGINSPLSPATVSRIANTEIPAFKNLGKHTVYKAAGVEKLRWVSIIDSRTRPARERVPRANHITMDKSETPLGTPFNMAVSGAKMYYPGDPSGPAYEVINCRCTIMPIGKPKR